MSKYTTEVRFICQNYTDDPDASIDQTIESAIPHIFNDWWNAGDEDHKKELEKKILRHYYTQEIGYETVGLWKLHLNQTLCDIMPKYNVLYENLSKIKAKLFETTDWSEEYGGHNIANGTSNQKTESSSKNDSSTVTHVAGNSKTDSNDTSELTGNDKAVTAETDKSNSNSSSKSDGTSGSEAWQEFNDTPQGGLDSIENRTYLTNATKNKSDSETHSNTTGVTTGNTTIDSTETTDTKQSTKGNSSSVTNDSNNSDSTYKATGSNESETNGKTGSESNSESTRHVTGKNSGGDYLSQYLNLQNQYNDIDQMIISDLQPLFMGLWE